MKTKLFPTLAFCLVAATVSKADNITLSSLNTGYYWYQKSTWTGGSDTTSGFSYGDESDLIHVQRNYQYYGGSSRFWQQKDAYFQIDLSSLAGEGGNLTLAMFHFYVTENNTTAETFLNHLGTQSTLRTGDAGQKLAGSTNVVSSTTLVPGWNSIDLTSYIQLDLANGYTYTVLSIPQFAQVQDENRLLSFYGASASATIEGVSVKPYLEVSVVPEPESYTLVAAGTFCALYLFGRHRRMAARRPLS